MTISSFTCPIFLTHCNFAVQTQYLENLKTYSCFNVANKLPLCHTSTTSYCKRFLDFLIYIHEGMSSVWFEWSDFDHVIYISLSKPRNGCSLPSKVTNFDFKEDTILLDKLQVPFTYNQSLMFDITLLSHQKHDNTLLFDLATHSALMSFEKKIVS